MADRMFHPHEGSLDVGLVMMQGSFRPNGTSAVSSSTVKGNGFSVARTGVGEFTVTLEDKYVELISGSLSLQLAAADDQILHWGAIDVASAKTLVINVWDISDAAAADIAADASNVIHFCLMLKNSSVD